MKPVSSHVPRGPIASQLARHGVLVLCVAFCSLAATRAQAQTGDREIAFTARPDYLLITGDTKVSGAGLGLGVSWGFHPLWNVFGQLDYGHGFVAGPGDDVRLSSLIAGIGINLDVVTLVPWGRIGVGGRFDSRLRGIDGAPLDGAAMLELGLDYRKRRHWSMGFSVQARSAFRPEFRPVDRVRIGLRFSWVRQLNRIRY